MLPHKIFEEERFFEKAKQLRARFEVDALDTLFLSDAEQKNVPMDGMPIFIDACKASSAVAFEPEHAMAGTLQLWMAPLIQTYTYKRRKAKFFFKHHKKAKIQPWFASKYQPFA